MAVKGRWAIWSLWDWSRKPDKPRLALNTYCRPFFVPPSHLGMWCPEGRSIRVICFDPDQLKAFDLAEIAGWFKASSERIYSAAAPLAEFEVSLGLAAGVHKLEVPAELQTVDELIVPTSYPAKSPDEPGLRPLRHLSKRGTGRGPAAEMVYRQSISGGKAMDHAGGPRSRVAPYFWRVFWDRQLPAGGRRMPPGTMAGKDQLKCPGK